MNRLEDLVQLSKFCIPRAELREQVRLFRHLKSNAAHSRAFSSVPPDHDMATSTRRQSASKRAGRARIDSGQRACFPIRDFCWGLERSRSSASDWRARAGRGCCARRILASVHCAFSTCRLFASRVQSFRALRSRSAARALHRHDPISRVLSNFRARLQRRGGCFNRDRAGSGQLNSLALQAASWAWSAHGRDFYCDIVMRHSRNSGSQTSA